MHLKKVISLFEKNKDIFFIIFIHLIITIPIAYILNIWYDESISLSTSSGSIIKAIQNSVTDELQPPVYFVLLTIWRKLDSSYFFARLLSILFSSASIFISYKFIKKFLNVKNYSLAAFLISINPFLIYYSLEIRLYTFLIFLSGILIYLMYEIYLYGNNSKLHRIIFTLISILAIHTQYYMLFFIFGIGVTVLIYKGWERFKIFLIDMVLPAISLIGIIPYFDSVTSQAKLHGATIKLKLVSNVNFIITRINSYIFASDSSLGIYNKYENIFFILLIAIIFLFSIKKHLKEFFKVISLKKYSTLPIILILLACLLIIIFKMGRGPLTIRHTAILFLPLLYFVITLINISSNRKILVFWFILFVSLYSITLVKTFRPPLGKEGDGIRIAEYLEKHEKENQLILVPYNIIGMPLKVHYVGNNSIISLYDSLSSEKSKSNLLKLIKSKSEFWWDFPYPYPTWSFLFNQMKITEIFIDEKFTVIDKKYFKGNQLWYLKKK
jgi:uncharacterized membrane protein